MKTVSNRSPIGLNGLWARYIKLNKIERNPLPEQLSTPWGTTNYRQPIPVHDFTGNQGLMNFWNGNQVPTAHIMTPPHAHYLKVRAAPVEVQRAGITWQGRVLSVLDSARLTAAMRAAWLRLGDTQQR